MGKAIDKLQKDIEDYKVLCKYFEVEPKYFKGQGNGDDAIDCYGKHVIKLKKKFKKEIKKECK